MIRYNKNLFNVIRNKGKPVENDFLRLHASERDLPFNELFWNDFINTLKQENIKLYPDIPKSYDLLSTFLSIDKKFITISEGSDRVIKNIFECFSIEKLGVLTTNPCFPLYEVYAKLSGSNLVKIDYKSPTFPFDEFIENITDNINLVIISNPSSPVGDILTLDQIKIMAEKCKKTNSILVIDEAYIEFTDYDSVESLVHYYNLIIVRTFSKAFGSAGIRIGYSISNNEIKKCLDQVASMNEVSHIAIVWLEVFLKHYKQDNYISIVKSNKKIICDLLDSKGLIYLKSYTNYINVKGNLNLSQIEVKKAVMPWDNEVYTRFSIPTQNLNFLLKRLNGLKNAH